MNYFYSDVICCTNVIVGQEKPPPDSTVGANPGDERESSGRVNNPASGEQGTTNSPTEQPDQTRDRSSSVPQGSPREPVSPENPNPVTQIPGNGGALVTPIPLPKLTLEDSESSKSVADIEVKSALLKNYDGVKITGPCRSYFRVMLVPHITVYVYATYDRIQLEPKFGPSDLIDINDLTNKCNKDSNKYFKLVLYIKNNILILKWKVQDKDSKPTSINKMMQILIILKFKWNK